ncbi:leucyl aminopeptidase [Nocardioides sp. NPDC057767]|uniref:leucyl aminopeptidase n=1 Tax=unclassified Nocardioides TaxID=2615069 RepID=UPI00366D2000
MTRLTVTTELAASQPADYIVIGVVKGATGPALAPGAAGLATAFDAGLAERLAVLGMSGAAGEVVKLAAPPRTSTELVLAVGLGEGPDIGAWYDTESLRQAAGTVARHLAGAAVAVIALPVRGAESVEAVALGAVLGAYTFNAYRTAGHQRPAVEELAILVDGEDRSVAQAAVRRAGVIGREVNRARDLVNTPANDLYPETFADTAADVGRRHGLTVDVLDHEELAAGGFGGILGVGQGSARPPRLVRITHTHPEATATLALVGKGITYDSGGISLKPVGANEIMKRDMSGAAAVLGAVVAAARLGLKVNITGWLALAENMPSGSALRPGDVLRMYGGRTVEVLNTDAEGRLVLADTLVRAGEEKPDAIVDVATLTAAMRFGLGNHVYGVMSNDDAFRAQVVGAAGVAGERAWPMPLVPELRKSLDSRVADIANFGDRMGGGLVAGLFLQEFVPPGIPWAHLDIAGPAFHEGEPYGYTPDGGTGCAVRTLVQVAEGLASEAEADRR